MDFLHLADLHLGRSLCGFDLIEDQRFILEQILDIADSRSVGGVLIAGDVYDKSIPSEAATNLLDYFLNELAKRRIATFIVSGNHDSDERLNYGSALFSSSSIYISAVFDGTLHCKSISCADTDIDVYMLPFIKASQVRHYFPDADIRTYDDAVRTVIANTPIDRKKKNILVAHQFVAGYGEDPELAGSEGTGAFCVGDVERIGYGCFDAFDYVALGHIHSPQRVGRDGVRYAGSPLKYSLREAYSEKSVTLISVNARGVQSEQIPLSPSRDLREIRGNMAELLAPENVRGEQDFIYAVLTDEDIVPDAMSSIRQVYPNTVRIEYSNSHTRAVGEVDIGRIAENRSFPELIGEFYQMVYGCGISDEEMDIMYAAAREAGVIQ